MDSPLIAVADAVFPSRLAPRLAVLRSRRRRLVLRTWGTRLAALTGFVWVALVVVVSLVH
jgi:hypothetical protein